MAKNPIRGAVEKMVAPFLKEHGFEQEPKTEGGVMFKRKLRGWENEIFFDCRKQMGSYFFRMYVCAPKYYGGLNFPRDRMFLPGDTESELAASMRVALHSLETEVFPFLDTYTPGNIFPWEEHVERLFGPVLTCMGFVRKTTKVWLDKPVYVRVKPPYHEEVVTIDLQVPWEFGVCLWRWRTFPAVHSESPPVRAEQFRYSNHEEFVDSLAAAAAFVEREAAAWFDSLGESKEL